MDKPIKPASSKPVSPARDLKKERLAAALKANLRRRKAASGGKA